MQNQQTLHETANIDDFQIKIMLQTGAYLQFNTLQEHTAQLTFVGYSNVNDQASDCATVFLGVSQCSESGSFLFYSTNLDKLSRLMQTKANRCDLLAIKIEAFANQSRNTQFSLAIWSQTPL